MGLISRVSSRTYRFSNPPHPLHIPVSFPSLSNMSDNENKPKADEGATEHVNLKVCGQDGSVVQFKIKKNTQLKKLMNAYCDRQGLDINQIRFRFDGTPINETDSPASLDMEDDDTIDVFTQQTGGR